MLRFPVSPEVWRAGFSAQANTQYDLMTVSRWALMERNCRSNCMLIKKLRRYDPRGRLRENRLFDLFSGRFTPHPAHKSALRAEAATHFLAPVKRGWSPTSLGRGAWGVTSLSSHSVAPDRWPLSRHSPLPPLATLRSTRVPSRRREIGFVFPLDPAFVRRKSLCTSD